MENLLPTFGRKVVKVLGRLPVIDEDVSRERKSQEKQKVMRNNEEMLNKLNEKMSHEDNEDDTVRYPKVVNARDRNTPYDDNNPSPLSIKHGIAGTPMAVKHDRVLVTQRTIPTIFSHSSNWQRLLVYNLQENGQVDVFANAAAADSGVILRRKCSSTCGTPSHMLKKPQSQGGITGSTAASSTRKNMKNIATLLPDTEDSNPGMAHISVNPHTISVYPRGHQQLPRHSQEVQSSASVFQTSTVSQNSPETIYATSKVSATSSKTTATPETPPQSTLTQQSSGEASFMVNHAKELLEFPGISWVSFSTPPNGTINHGSDISDTIASFKYNGTTTSMGCNRNGIPHQQHQRSKGPNPVRIRIQNTKTDSSLTVYRVGKSSQYQLECVIQPLNAWEVETYDGQPWCVVDSFSNRGGIVKVGAVLATHRRNEKYLLWKPLTQRNQFVSQRDESASNSSLSLIAGRKGVGKPRKGLSNSRKEEMFTLLVTVLP